MKAEHIETIEGARLWAVQHDGIVLPAWERQETYNRGIEHRLSSLEKKIYVLTGTASVVGLLLGLALKSLAGE